MGRSLKVDPDCIKRVKAALHRNGFPSQQALAIDLGFSRSTVANFCNGKPVDYLNFVEASDKLGLNWQEIALKSDSETTDAIVSNYVERPPIETICSEVILRPGSLIRIKAPKKWGKTLLKNRLLQFSTKQNYRSANLNLLEAEDDTLNDLDRFLRWFCVRIAKELHLPKDGVTEIWDEDDPSTTNCTMYLEEVVLESISTALVLSIDDIDRVLTYPIASNFLALLRSWHERARVNTLWKKLRLVIVYSTDAYIPLDINRSPFNVGEPIELPEFTAKQILELAKKRQVEWDPDSVEQLMQRVGGHPYLVDRAICHLKDRTGETLENVLELAATEAGIYRNHLRDLWLTLQEHSELAEATKAAIASTESIRLEPNITYKLYSLGVVKLDGNNVVIRCPLYRDYLGDRLNN